MRVKVTIRTKVRNDSIGMVAFWSAYAGGSIIAIASATGAWLWWYIISAIVAIVLAAKKAHRINREVLQDVSATVTVDPVMPASVEV